MKDRKSFIKLEKSKVNSTKKTQLPTKQKTNEVESMQKTKEEHSFIKLTANTLNDTNDQILSSKYDTQQTQQTQPFHHTNYNVDYYDSNSYNVLSKENSSSKIDHILNKITYIINNQIGDPILSIFKSSPVLHNSFLKRLFEIIESSLKNDQLKEIKDLNEHIIILNNIISDKENTINTLVTSENFLKDTLNETLQSYDIDLIQKNKNIDYLQDQLSQFEQKYNSLEKTLEKYRILNDESNNEHKQLNEKINKLTDNLIIIENKYKSLKDDYDLSIRSIQSLKNSTEQWKSNNHKLTADLENLTIEKISLQNELMKNTNFINDLNKKIENLTDELNIQSQSVNKEVIEKEDLKLKNKALKNKLFEKLSIIEELEKTGYNISITKEREINELRLIIAKLKDERKMVINEINK